MRLLFFFASVFLYSLAYKIIIIAPDISNSQRIFNKRVAETLAKGGHEVHLAFLSTFRDRKRSEVKIDQSVKVRFVDAFVPERSWQEMEKMQGEVIFEDLPFHNNKLRRNLDYFMGVLTATCRETLKNKEFLKWLETENFDVAIVHMYSACPIGLVHLAKIKAWIWMNSGLLMDFVSDAIGVPLIPSYVPPNIMEAHDTLNFIERTKSFIGHGLSKIFWRSKIANVETAMFREEIDPNFPSLIDLARSCPLVMVNSNELYDLPRPILAKVIPIGGIGMQLKDVKPLSKEFAEIADKGKGMVVISFGSVAPANLIPERWKKALLGAFARLPEYQFVMRYNAQDLKARCPSNVHTFDWLPQADLVQHENTKLIMTHGGYNSMQEAIAAGKPLVMVALFGDQPKNTKLAEKRGIAAILSKGNFTEDSIYDALVEVLENPSYTKNIERLSAMVKKRPFTSEELLIKWTEFLAEFQTLENLVPAGQNLNFFQYHSIDVLAFLASIIFIVLFVIYLILSLIFSCVKSLLFSRKVKFE